MPLSAILERAHHGVTDGLDAKGFDDPLVNLLVDLGGHFLIMTRYHDDRNIGPVRFCRFDETQA